jgi:Delta24-sterol reductase
VEIDANTKTVLIESNVPMDKFVHSTLELGLIPPMVIEFPGITAGGGFAGTFGKSSSFRYGFFDHTVHWIEMILANGDIVITSNSDKSDLFHGTVLDFVG